MYVYGVFEKLINIYQENITIMGVNMALKFANAIYSFILVFITSLISKYFTDKGLDSFYDTLITPDVTPDGKYFGMAWGIIYFLLFLSFFLILSSKKTDEQSKDAHALFISQLFLQILWCFSFFYMEQLWASSIVIVVLDMVVALMLHTFFYINKWAFILLLPYLAWILFATYLNIFIIFLN